MTTTDPTTTIDRPDLSAYPPAVRRLIALLTEQVIYHCTIPGEGMEAAGRNEREEGDAGGETKRGRCQSRQEPDSSPLAPHDQMSGLLPV